MFGDSRRKLRAWYQAEDPSQAEEVCMDDSNPKAFNAVPTPTFCRSEPSSLPKFLLSSCFSMRVTPTNCLPSIWRLSRLIFL